MTAGKSAGADLRERLQQILAGSFTIERELGGGGMSRVFLAEETRLGRQVVVKVTEAKQRLARLGDSPRGASLTKP